MDDDLARSVFTTAFYKFSQSCVFSRVKERIGEDIEEILIEFEGKLLDKFPNQEEALKEGMKQLRHCYKESVESHSMKLQSIINSHFTIADHIPLFFEGTKNGGDLNRSYTEAEEEELDEQIAEAQQKLSNALKLEREMESNTQVEKALQEALTSSKEIRRVSQSHNDLLKSDEGLFLERLLTFCKREA